MASPTSSSTAKKSGLIEKMSALRAAFESFHARVEDNGTFYLVIPFMVSTVDCLGLKRRQDFHDDLYDDLCDGFMTVLTTGHYNRSLWWVSVFLSRAFFSILDPSHPTAGQYFHIPSTQN